MAMVNIFCLFGDYIHLLAFTVLLLKIWTTKNCAGISGKTQVLFAIAFTAKYLDITAFGSLYTGAMKILFVSVTYFMVVSIYGVFRTSNDRQHDTFRIELLILPAAILALTTNQRFHTFEIFQSFSIYLDTIAILPQIHHASKAKKAESIVISYICALGLYQGLYITNWIYRYYAENYYDPLSVASSLIQMIFYCDFFARNIPIYKMNSDAANDEESQRNRTIGCESLINSDNHCAVPEVTCEKEMEALRNKDTYSSVLLTPETRIEEEKGTLLPPPSEQCTT